MLPRFIEKYPGVDITLLDDNSRSIERMIVAEEVDFGICSCTSTDDRLTFEALMQDEYGLVCNTAHPVARRKSMTWQEIASLPLLGSAAHHQLMHYPQAPELAEPRVFISNMMSLLSMLDRGLGIALLAALAIPPYYADRLRFVPLTGPRIKRDLGILRLTKRSFSAPALSLLALIEEHVAATLPELAIPA